MADGCTAYADKINQLIAQATETLTCNADCQKQKQADELQQRYSSLASCSSSSGQAQTQEAQRNYIVFTQGQGAYNDFRNNQLQSQVQEIVDQFTKNFNNEVTTINSQINTYNGIVINFRNILDLYIQYKKENIELFKEFKTEKNGILINERKTFYEDQNIDSLGFYYFYFLLSIYVICVVCFIIFYFIYPAQNSWKVILGIVLLLIAIPFISSWVLATIIYLLYRLYEILPKNVYAQNHY
jgi:hypothetical protein